MRKQLVDDLLADFLTRGPQSQGARGNLPPPAPLSAALDLLQDVRFLHVCFIHSQTYCEMKRHGVEANAITYGHYNKVGQQS
jgi:hypothetical protein